MPSVLVFVYRTVLSLLFLNFFFPQSPSSHSSTGWHIQYPSLVSFDKVRVSGPSPSNPFLFFLNFIPLVSRVERTLTPRRVLCLERQNCDPFRTHLTTLFNQWDLMSAIFSICVFPWWSYFCEMFYNWIFFFVSSDFSVSLGVTLRS